MANTFLTPSIIAREALMILENNLVFLNLVHRGHTEEFEGRKVGDTITVRGPASFTAQEFTGSTTTQDAGESSVALVLEKHFDITVNVTSKDWTLELEEFNEQILRPVVVAHAQALDNYIAGKYVEVYNHVGTAGDPPDSIADLTLVNKMLRDQKVPNDTQRFCVLNPQGEADFLQIEAVHSAEKRGDGGDALRRAAMGEIMNLQWFVDQNIQDHTTGTMAAESPLVNGVVAAGDTTMDIDGGSASETIKKGDVFTVANAPGQYVFTADATATTGAITGAAFTPAAPTGGFADNAAITIAASHAANLAFHRNAITAAVVPLALPQGASNAEYIGDRGLGIRVVSDYDTSSKSDTISFDLLVGAKVQQPELAGRVLG